MKKIVISASSSLQDEIEKWAKFFQSREFDILNWPKPIKAENFLAKFPLIHKEFYESLNDTDILFVANEHKNNMNGYIGPAVFAEISFVMGLKLSQNKKIRIILNQKPSLENCFHEDIMLWLDNGWLEVFDESNV